MVKNTQDDNQDPVVREFLTALESSQFAGKISDQKSDRVVHATDNSIFEIEPQAIIYASSEDDICLVMKQLGEKRFRNICLTARGGGTSTNGQSLGGSLVLDTTRYMNQILSVEPENSQATVQSGVVLDELNRELKRHGRMFAATTSSSSRVTLGGMISTDASGIGSMVWGKTSDHILSLRLVLLGGQVLDIKRNMALDQSPWPSLKKLLRESASEFKAKVPSLPRFFSGYNLLCQTEESSWNLVRLVAGSEGTLGVISQCTVRTSPLASRESLFLVIAKDMDSCLRLGDKVRQRAPAAMELLDENILKQAENDVSLQVSEETTALFRAIQSHHSPCALFVSFRDYGQKDYEQSVHEFEEFMQQLAEKPSLVTYVCSEDPELIQSLWNIRKKSVGLYGRLALEEGRKHQPPKWMKSVSFIEDCAVSPQKVSQFIKEFRELLDSLGLTYGMYGHLDAGCVHLRPQLDQDNPDLAEKIAKISDETFALTLRHGGILWGEHGKGFRSEYLREFLGDQLYEVFARIKELFDPHHQLNPGKICPPYSHLAAQSKLLIPLRAEKEKAITPVLKSFFFSAIACDGNGMCFQHDPEAVMCPSYQATGSRIHSPKGRAMLLRQWLWQKSHASWLPNPYDGNVRQPVRSVFQFVKRRFQCRRDPFASEVYKAFDGCLSCKGCTRGCPLHVDVPELKSRFLYHYHGSHRRSLRDHFLGSAERLLPWVASFRLSRIIYHFVTRSWPKAWMVRLSGMSDFPLLCHSPRHRPCPGESYDVIIIPDLMSRYMAVGMLAHARSVFGALGAKVFEAPYRESGKSWHTLGFLRCFRKVATQNQEHHRKLKESHPQASLVAIDPGLALVYRQEYQTLTAQVAKASTAGAHQNSSPVEKVWLPQELLKRLTDSHHDLPNLKEWSKDHRVYLYGHCFEASSMTSSGRQWVEVMAKLGVDVTEKKVGCCGLAGFWGYKQENAETSQKIFDLSWLKAIKEACHEETQNIILLITGGSCRHQVARSLPTEEARRVTLYHPLEYLALLLDRRSSSKS